MARYLLSLFAVTLAVSFFTLNPAHATWIEAPVTGLDGYIPPQKTGTFAISVNPSEIVRVRIRIIGNLVWPSYYGCPHGNGSVNGYNFFATMSTTSGDWFTSVVYVDQRVSFVAYLDWQPSEGATWDFLLSGGGTFLLTGTPRPLPDGCSYDHGSSDTTAEVIDAKIMIELGDPNPVEQSTWGRIKSLFLDN